MKTNSYEFLNRIDTRLNNNIIIFKKKKNSNKKKNSGTRFT